MPHLSVSARRERAAASAPDKIWQRVRGAERSPRPLSRRPWKHPLSPIVFAAARVCVVASVTHVRAAMPPGDFHGGNVLIDAQGLVWIIDFMTVQTAEPVCGDLSKLLACILGMYLPAVPSDDAAFRELCALLATQPDMAATLPAANAELSRKTARAERAVEGLSGRRNEQSKD